MKNKIFLKYEQEWINNKKYWLTDEKIEPPKFPIIIIDNFDNWI
jgi:hypothetical protein